MKLRKYLLVLIVLFLVGCKQDTPVETPPIIEPSPSEEEIPSEEVPTPEELQKTRLLEYIDTLSIDEKVGQLIISGFEGTAIGEREIRLIRDYNVGGFIFFQRNISTLTTTKELIEDLNDINDSNFPLFLSIDEEGGQVSRLSGIYRNLPSINILGIKNQYQLSYEYGYIQGLKIRSLGFNLNYAPVLDVDSNPNNPVIGKRSISNNPVIVYENGLALIDGFDESGVISVAKHFPGHGDTEVDSHVDLPKVDKSKEELLELELQPFIGAIEHDVPAIMVGHILLPQLDLKPATLSHEVITSLLRMELGFQGLIISDDMTMGAITNYYGIEDASLDFLKAGGDLLLVCHGDETPFLVINRIKEGIINGEIDEDFIDEKLLRIFKVKESLDDKSLDIRKEELEKLIYDYLEKLK